MSVKDWCTVAFWSIIMFAVMLLVGYGALSLFIDTGRAILH